MRRTWLHVARTGAVMLAAALVIVAPATAASETRVALVIGNSAYSHTVPLRNPPNDAADVAAALDRLGFDVVRANDLTYEGLRRTLLAFKERSAEASVSVVFYAGHAIEMDGENYLVPVDGRLAMESDVQLEAVPADLVLSATEGASRLRVMVLDACRNNPFEVRSGNASRGTRIGRGLAELDDGRLGNNIVVAYATAAGFTADDGPAAARNSPFTQALKQHLETPNLEVHMMFRHVRDTVMRLTGSEQRPYLYASLSAEPYYLNPAASTSVNVSDPGAQKLVETLGRPLSPVTQHENGWTDLHYAAVLNLPRLVAALAERGADVDAALLRDQGEIGSPVVSALQALGAPAVGRLRRDGATPLHLAVRSRSRGAADELLARGADVDRGDAAGRTPLHDAAALGDAGLLRTLLSKGASVRARDALGDTPLHVAARAGARGAIPTLVGGGADLEARNDTGATPLDVFGRGEVREPPVEAPRSGDSYPVAAGRPEAPREAFEVVGPRPVQATDALFWDSIRNSSDPGNFEEYLRRWPAGQFAVVARGRLTELAEGELFEAARSDDVDRIGLSFGRGARAETTDAAGYSPLHHAAQANAAAAVARLIAEGAPVDARTVVGNTPLHLAVLRGAHDAVRALMQAGADARAMNNGGQTPLFIARLRSDATVVAELER